MDSGPFVKVFRNKDKFIEALKEQNVDLGKLKSKHEEGLKLAEKAGLKTEHIDGFYGHGFNPAVFYPEYQEWSEEGNCWIEPIYPRANTAVWPELPKKDGFGSIPLPVLEEVETAREYGFFERIEIRYFIRNKLLVGCQGEQRYPMVFWGEKTVYETIQRKLQDLRKKKEEARKAKELSLAEAKRKEDDKAAKELARAKISASEDGSPKKKIKEALFVLVLLLSAWGTIQFIAEGFRVDAEKELEEKGVSVLKGAVCVHCTDRKIYVCKSTEYLRSGTVEMHYTFGCNKATKCPKSYYIELNSYDGAIPVTERVFGELKAGDEIPCAYCNITNDKIYNSVDQLPDGQVGKKDNGRCHAGHPTYSLGLKLPNFPKNRFMKGVTKEVYDLLKVGDKVPTSEFLTKLGTGPCRYCGYKTVLLVKSTARLPSGLITKKQSYPCLDGEELVNYYLFLDRDDKSVYNAIPVTKKVYEAVKVDDKVPFKETQAKGRKLSPEEVKNLEKYFACKDPPLKSVYAAVKELPDGRITYKNEFHCLTCDDPISDPPHKIYLLLIVRNTNGGSFDGSVCKVSKAVFDSVKEGDTAPFKEMKVDSFGVPPDDWRD